MISAYKIHWIEFRATSGIVTKNDLQILARSPILARNYSSGKCNYMEHFASRCDAVQYLDKKARDFERLGKKYEVRICTDRQFGLGRYDTIKRMHIIEFTAKQKAEMFTIG